MFYILSVILIIYIVYRFRNNGKFKMIIDSINRKINNHRSKTIKNLTKDQKYNHIKVNKEKEVDRILEKIHQRGLKSLSNKEKKFLDEHSR